MPKKFAYAYRKEELKAKQQKFLLLCGWQGIREFVVGHMLQASDLINNNVLW